MDDRLIARDQRPDTAKLYSRTAAIHERSARVLRASGHAAAAEHAEWLAAGARDRITESTAVMLMYTLAARFRRPTTLTEVLDAALDGAITLLAADLGNIQLAHPHTNALRIACQRGFGDEFLAHFAVVEEGEAACGRAAASRRQAVIADVDDEADFAAHRDIAHVAGFRAVQSTPLIDRAGRMRGVLSTHFRRPHRPAAHELRLTETYARLAADAITRTRPRA